MRRWRIILASAWWSALTIWFAAIIAPAAAAMVAFPRLPEIEAVIPATGAFFSGDPESAGRFVAGFVTNPIFVASDVVRLAVVGVAWLSVLVSRGRPSGHGRWSIVAMISMAIASTLFAISFLFVAAPLAEALELWRAAVFAGDHGAAADAKAIFDPLHLTASRLMSTELIFVVIAILAAGASTAASTAPESTSC